MRVPNAITRDETVDGEYYYRAAEADIIVERQRKELDLAVAGYKRLMSEQAFTDLILKAANETVASLTAERDAVRAEVEKLRVLLESLPTAYNSGFKAGIEALKRLVAASDGCVYTPDGDDVGAMLEFGEAMDAARAAIRGDL